MKSSLWTYVLLFHLPLVCFTDCTSKNDESQQATSDSAVAYPISLADGKHPPILPISEQLQSMIDELEPTLLTEKKTVNEIPTFIRTFLDSLSGGFSIANPGKEWQEGCVIDHVWITRKEYDPKTGDSVLVSTQDMSQPLPSRQMIYFGLGENIALMSYNTGGWGKCVHVMIIRFERYQVTDYWHGYGEGDLTNKQEIVNYLKVETALHRRIDASLVHI